MPGKSPKGGGRRDANDGEKKGKDDGKREVDAPKAGGGDGDGKAKDPKNNGEEGKGKGKREKKGPEGKTAKNGAGDEGSNEDPTAGGDDGGEKKEGDGDAVDGNADAASPPTEEVRPLPEAEVHVVPAGGKRGAPAYMKDVPGRLLLIAPRYPGDVAAPSAGTKDKKVGGDDEETTSDAAPEDGADGKAVALSMYSVERAFRDCGFAGDSLILAGDGGACRQPHRQAVLSALQWVVSPGLPAGSSVLIVFQGCTAYDDRDEKVLLPSDFASAGGISVRWLVGALKSVADEGLCNAVIVVDSVGLPAQQDAGGVRLADIATTPVLGEVAVSGVHGSEEATVLPPRDDVPPGLYPETPVVTVITARPAAPFFPQAALRPERTTGLSAALAAAVRGERYSATPAGNEDDASDDDSINAVLAEQADVFTAAAVARFGDDVLDAFKDGGYTARDFAAWAGKSVADVQKECEAAAVPLVRAGPLQNLAQQLLGGDHATSTAGGASLAAPSPRRRASENAGGMPSLRGLVRMLAGSVAAINGGWDVESSSDDDDDAENSAKKKTDNPRTKPTLPRRQQYDVVCMAASLEQTGYGWWDAQPLDAGAAADQDCDFDDNVDRVSRPMVVAGEREPVLGGSLRAVPSERRLPAGHPMVKGTPSTMGSAAFDMLPTDPPSVPRTMSPVSRRRGGGSPPQSTRGDTGATPREPPTADPQFPDISGEGALPPPPVRRRATATPERGGSSLPPAATMLIREAPPLEYNPQHRPAPSKQHVFQPPPASTSVLSAPGVHVFVPPPGGAAATAPGGLLRKTSLMKPKPEPPRAPVATPAPPPPSAFPGEDHIPHDNAPVWRPPPPLEPAGGPGGGGHARPTPMPARHPLPAGGGVRTPAPRAGDNLELVRGYVPAGRDLFDAPRWMTLADAKAICLSDPRCAAFSLQIVGAGENVRAWVYFKTTDAVCAAGDGWWTCRKRRPAGRAPAVPRPPHMPDLAIQRQFQALFARYDPGKLPAVVGLLKHCPLGREAECLWELERSYGAPPTPPCGPDPPPLPRGWREVTAPEGDLYYAHADGRRQWVPPVFAAEL